MAYFMFVSVMNIIFISLIIRHYYIKACLFGMLTESNINKALKTSWGGSRISEEGVQQWKSVVHFPSFTLKFLMKMKEFASKAGFKRTP